MACFVLVHGAWHGGWCWANTERPLRTMGHEGFSPTLTGQGDRSHLLTPDITPDSHVTDIMNFIRWRDLENIILVGHSYGGLVTTGVAAQMPERLRALIYLDAFVPEVSGASIFANANPARMAKFQEQIDAGAHAVAPDHFDSWTDNPETKQWLIAKCTPQPVGTLSHGVTLTGAEAQISHKHFIIAQRNTPSAFWPEYHKIQGRPGWTHDSIDAKHDAMVDAGDVLARKLDAYARKICA